MSKGGKSALDNSVSVSVVRGWDFKKQVSLSVLLIFLAVVLCYFNSLHVPFVFDDYNSILGNPLIKDLKNFFTGKFFKRPRALVDLTFALNYAAGATDVVGYHLVNVFIHFINGLLVYVLVLSLFSALQDSGHIEKVPSHHAQWVALSAALIFVCHPVQTQAVTYVVQRYTSMAASFYLLSALLFIRGRLLWIRSTGGNKTGSLSLFFLSFASAVCAFLSKQNAASLPLTLMLLEFILFDRSWKGWRRKLLYLLPVFAVFAALVLFNVGGFRGAASLGKLLEDVDRATRETAHISRSTYFLTQLRVLCVYLALMFFPRHQCVDYRYAFGTRFFQSWTPLAAGLLIGLVVLAVLVFRKKPLITLAVGWFFLTLSVESSVFPIRDALFEHRLYLPLFGFSLFSGEVIAWLVARRRIAGVAALVSVTIALGTATHFRNEVWSDPARLWQEAVACNPRNDRAYNNLGKVYLDRKEYRKAQEQFETALKIRPTNPYAQLNLGLALAHQGRLGEAIVAFKRVLRLRPNDAEALYNIALAYHRLHLYEDAEKYYKKALKANPRYENAALNLANLHMEQKKPKEAITLLKRFLKTNPTSYDVAFNLAMIEVYRGHFPEALKAIDRALKIRPQSVDALLQKGLIAMKLGDRNAARNALETVIRLNPHHRYAQSLLQRLSQQ